MSEACSKEANRINSSLASHAYWPGSGRRHGADVQHRPLATEELGIER